MRSALYTGNSTIVVEERPAVPPAAGEVQIEVAYTGICGTDLHILHGDMDSRVRIPQTIGHEMSGRIADVGPGVTGLTVGAPVTVMPLRWCGACPACLAGHHHICHRLDFVGQRLAGETGFDIGVFQKMRESAVNRDILRSAFGAQSAVALFAIFGAQRLGVEGQFGGIAAITDVHSALLIAAYCVIAACFYI